MAINNPAEIARAWQPFTRCGADIMAAYPPAPEAGAAFQSEYK
jgi:hypothetical protein